MKLLFVLLTIPLFLLAGNIRAQNSLTPNDHAERLLNIYFSSELFTKEFKRVYGMKPFEFRLKNRSYFYEISHDVIESYKVGEFSFDTLQNYVFNQLRENETRLDLTNGPATEIRGVPLNINRGPGDPCTNMDFETGDFTGWELFEGTVNSNPYEMVGVNQIATPGAHHTIVTPGVDPLVGIPTTNPNGGGFSVMLGDATGTGALAASMRQTFLVDPNNAVFTYSYALVLEDPSGHTVGEKPFFKVNMYDQNGDPIACGDYEVIAGDINSGGDPDFIAYNAGYYLPWRTTFAPLDNYIGQNVTIEFIVGDCSQTGHYGYGYIDAECSPLDIVTSSPAICGNNNVTLTAPPGAASYLWTTNETTQEIDVNTPGQYSVDVVPVTGASCAITLDVTVPGSPGVPLADFTLAPTTICEGDNVTVQDISTATNGMVVDEWQWDFGDGYTVDGVQNEVHAYATAGTYDIELVAGVQGCYDTLVQPVTVESIPVADFTSNFVCEGTVTQFTDESTIATGTIDTWEWDFDSNTTIDNTNQNPTNGYSNAGSYNATLTVTTAGGCSHTITHPVVVNPVPSANFNWLDICENEVMNFTDASQIASGNITNWSWDMGDMTGTSNLQNPTYTYGAPGVYNVQLTVTSDSGCIDNRIYPVEMFANPIADFSVVDVCDQEVVILNDNSNANGGVLGFWSWDVQSDGVVDYNAQSTSHTYPSDGSYDIELIVQTTDGCSDTVTQTVTVNPAPVADYSFVSVCEGNQVAFTDNSMVGTGNIVNWDWDFANGNTSTQASPLELYSNEGNYNVSLTVTSNNNCTNTISQIVPVWPNPEPMFLVSNVCFGESINPFDVSTVSNSNTPNTITDWSWNFGDNPAGTSTDQHPTYTYGTDGAYNITLDVVTNNGCTNSVVLPVEVYPLPDLNISTQMPDGCSVWCVDFDNLSTMTSGNIDSYFWDFGDGNASTDETPTNCYTNNTLNVQTFDVTLTAYSDQGCSSTVTVADMITVYPNPTAEFSFGPQPTTIYDPTIDFTNESIGGDIYSWDFAGLGTSSDVHPQFTFPNRDAGTYTVCLEVENTWQCTAEICHDVIIGGEYNLYVPNAFTPDGDGVNDYFKPEMFGMDETKYKFMIFDRWGLLIYQTDNINNFWDGKYKGVNVQPDVYVWKIVARDRYEYDQKEYIGHVTVIR